MAKRGIVLCAAILIAASIVAVFAQVATHDFVNIDDYVYVTRNPNFEGGLTLANVAKCFQPYAAYWIPLTWLSLLVDFELYGDWAGGYLLTNVALHIAGSLLLFWWLIRLRASLGLATLLGLIFAIHPLHVESVAWVTERKDVLSGLLAFATLHLWTSWARESKPRVYVGVIALYVLTLLAKPAWMTLPVLLVALDLWPRFRSMGAAPDSLRSSLNAAKYRSWGRLVLEKVPLFGLAFAAGLMVLKTQASMGGMEQAVRIDGTTKLLNAMYSFGWYLLKAVWPTELAVLYPIPLNGVPLAKGLVPGAIVAALTLAAIGIGFRKGWRHVWVGWAWFLVPLLPVIGLVHVGIQARADRFMYLPLLGLGLLLGFSVERLLEGRALGVRRAVFAIGLLLCVALGIRAHDQVGYWKNTTTLFEHAIEVTEPNAYAHNRLAEQFKSELKFDEAEEHYAQAMLIDPNWATPILQYARMRQNLNDDRTANALGNVSDAIQTGVSQPDRRLGLAWMAAGRFRRARPHLERAVELDPDGVTSRVALARVLSGLGEPATALEQLNAALKVEPANLDAAAHAAWIQATTSDDALRDTAASIETGQAALSELRRKEALILDGLAAAHATAGQFAQAQQLQSQALQLAESVGDLLLVGSFRQRLDAYRRNLVPVDVPR